jgi:thiosulfate/3-mercaptopyruvate sulfurtransferase
MSLKGIFILIAGWAFTLGPGLNAQTQPKIDSMLVSTEWLSEHLSDPQLVILHYGMKSAYDLEHIPGARYVNIWEFLPEDEQGLRNELPEEGKLEEALRSLGIRNHSSIIICYEDINAISRAARLYLTLDYAGLADRVAMLDGGLQAWKEEGRPLSASETIFEMGDVDVQTREEVRMQKKEVFANLHQEDVVLVDARPADRYYGAERDSNSPRQGHIEGAVNIPYFKFTGESGTHLLQPEEELCKLFEEYNIGPETTIIAYCGSGIWASTVYFAARYLGYNVRLYDGSIQEWGRDESLPMSKR